MASRPVRFELASTRVLAVAQGWIKRRVLQPLETFVKTVNGQAAHDEIKAYIVENDAVQTALATRVQELEKRVLLLTVLGVVLILAEVLRWIVR
jgi:hypothetical protein